VTVTDVGSLNVFQLFRLLVRSWKTIAVCTAVALLLAIGILQLSTPLHTVKMIVAKPPVPLEEQIKTASFAEGLLGGLTSTSAELGNFVALFSTLRLTEAMAEDQQLMRSVFRKEWSERDQAWRSPGFSLKRFLTNVVRTIGGQPRISWREPDAARLLGYLDANLKVALDRDTGMVTVAVEVSRPDDGLALLSSIYQNGERLLRTEYIGYNRVLVREINAKLATVQVSDYRANLLDILAEAEKKVMILESDLPYVASLFQPPRASVSPTSPAVNLVVSLAALGGIIAGCVIVIVRLQLRQGVSGGDN
jgi:LPS O-antigen subunit length determinant protein (WzzB/FepE family)